MLWYKAWLESRWRFLIGVAILMVLACGPMFEYPAVQKMMPLVRPDAPQGATGVIGRAIKEALEVERDYRGYIWYEWFGGNLTQIGTVLAALLGSGGLFSAHSGAGTLFTLSLPVLRSRLVAVRAITGLGELLAVAVVPSLMIPLLAPAVGQSYSVVDALVHAGCVFVVAAVFFGCALLLSTVFTDLWRPLLITCGVAVTIGLAEGVLRGSGLGLFAVMDGERYFRTGQLPWLGLLASAAAAAAMLYGTATRIARQDF